MSNEPPRAPFGLPAGPEIHQDDPAPLLPHHVSGLHVAMHESGAVHGRERSTDVLADERRLAGAERPMRAQFGGQSLAPHEFHTEADAILVRLDAEHIHDIGMPNLGERAALVKQPLFQLAVGNVLMKDLDGDFPLELRIPGAVDASKGAFPHLLQQRISSPLARAFR